MDIVNIRKIEIIIKDLLSEFEKECGKLQAEYDDNAARIIEIEGHILNFKENEDIDFKVFSPRKIDNQNEEKINNLKREKQNIELTNKSLFRQLRYYSEKIDKLNEILDIIDEDNTGVKKQDSPFDDIIGVDEKILAYYDSIVDGDDDSDKDLEETPSEKRRGWRLIKDELDSPILPITEQDWIDNLEASDTTVMDSLVNAVQKLEAESRAIDVDYFRTKEEIGKVLNSINDVLEKIKK